MAVNLATDSRARFRRLLELVILYGGLPVLLAANLPPKWLLPVLWGVAATVLGVLRASPGFDRRRLISWDGWGREWRPMLVRVVVATGILAGALWLYRPELLFQFPLHKPGLWLLVVTVYPLISVYPQALVFRALYQHRYAPLFASSGIARSVGALVFSLAHLPFGNGWALGLTLFGGVLFLRTYDRTESLLVSCVEHALYGGVLFTVGWGTFLYHGGTQALLAG